MTQTAPPDVSVIGLIIRDFARLPVADQARMKAQLEALTAIAIEPLSAADRTIVEAPGGLVAVVLGSAEKALEVAERAQAGAADLPVCIGVNYGPVRVGADQSGGQTLVGDGIVGAITLAGLATRGRFFVSRSFREALASAAPHRAADFGSLGVATDETVRTHELYVFDPAVRAQRQRRLVIVGAAAGLAAIVAGVGVRVALSSSKRLAVVTFQIVPQGEVLIDGEPRGKTPPLTRIEVHPGPHTIEVRSAGFAPVRLDINLKPGEEIKVTHEFTKQRGRAGKFMDDVRKRLGIE